MDVRTVRDELADALRVIPDVNVYTTVPDTVVFPAVIVGWPQEVIYHSTLARGMDMWTIPVVALVEQVTTAGQDLMAEMVSPAGAYSVRATLESMSTLNGTCDSLEVKMWRPLDTEEIAGYRAWGGQWTVEIIGSA